jgi:arginase
VRLGVTGAPIRSTVAESGVEMAPAALRAAGLFSRLQSMPNVSATDLGDAALPPPGETDVIGRDGRTRNPGRVRASLLAVAHSVSSARDQGLVPVVLGGDCSTLPAVLSGVRDAHDPPSRLGLVSWDGHADYHTSETSPNGDVAGMALALAVGRGDLAIARLARERFPAVDEPDVLRVGVRAVDPEEKSAWESSRVHRLPAATSDPATFAAAFGALSARCPDLIAHVNAGVLDAEEFSAASGAAPPGGLTRAQLRSMLVEASAWARDGKVRWSAIVWTGVDPRKDVDQSQVRSLVELVTELVR